MLLPSCSAMEVGGCQVERNKKLRWTYNVSSRENISVALPLQPTFSTGQSGVPITHNIQYTCSLPAPAANTTQYRGYELPLGWIF